MDADEETDSMGEKPLSLVWKEPINGKTAFFTEEVYQQLAGPEPSLEDRVMKLMDAMGFPPPSKSSTSHKSSFQNAKQRSVDSDLVSESSSQDSSTASVATVSKTEDVSASSSSSQQALAPESVNDVGRVFVPVEMPASSDAPMSYDDPQDNKPRHHTLQCEPQRGTSDAVMTSACTSTSFGDKGWAGLESEVSDPKRPLEDQGQATGGGHQGGEDLRQRLWTGSHLKVGGAGNSVKGQAGYPAPQRKSKVPDKARRPQAPEAPKSCLSHEQHMRYMYLFKKFSQRFISGFSNPPTQSECVELQEFQDLQLQVGSEQEQCQNQLKQAALLNPFLYTHLPAHINQYTKEKEESGWKRVESYCRYYSPCSQLPLMAHLQQPGPALPAMTLVRTLLKLGSKCKVVMPDLSPNPNARLRRTVCTDLQKVSARFPSVYTSSQRAWNHEPASKDVNLASLVQKYSCHVATSASVLHQLIDNHAPDFGVAWDIPVIVKECGNDAASGKVVFLDKALHPKPLSAGDKKAQYLRKAVRAYMCQPHNERKSLGSRGRSMKEPSLEEVGKTGERSRAHGRTLNTQTEEEDDPFGSVSMEDLETFGSDKLFSSRKVAEATGSDKLFSSRKVAEATGSDKLFSSRKVAEATGSDKLFSSRKVAEAAGGRGKQRQSKPPTQMPGNCVSEGLGTEMSGLAPKTDGEGEDESMQTSETESLRDEGMAGNRPAPKQDLEDKDAQTTAKTDTSLSFNSPARGTRSSQRGSGTVEQELSTDTDDDALVIADALSPARSSGSPGAQQPVRRWNSSSRNGIFDEAPGSGISVTDGSVELAQIQSPRRITRSVSQKLQSPTGIDEVKRSASTEGSSILNTNPTSTASSDPVSLTAAESTMAASVSTSPRTTRQSAKRKSSESLPSSEQAEGSGGAAEERRGSKRGRKAGGGGEDPPAAVTSTVDTPQCREENAGRGEVTGSASAKPVSEKGTESEKKQGCNAAPSYLDSLLTEMTAPGNTATVRAQEDPRQYAQPGSAGDRVGYHLWDLAGLRLLVRCNSHAFVRDMLQQEKAVYVSAKPERQIPQGLEQNTLRECVAGWLGCYLRPNSYLLRARVNMQNYEVVHTEELQLNQILQPTLNFNPHHAFAVLSNILTKLTELSPGDYLLSHEAGANHVVLRSGTNTRRGSYDLRSQYMGLPLQEADKTLAWVPVDPTLILPQHWRLGLIPVTFQPPDFDPKRKKQQFLAPKKKQRNRKKQN